MPPLFSDFPVYSTHYKGPTFGISCFLSCLLPTFFDFSNENAIIHFLKNKKARSQLHAFL